MAKLHGDVCAGANFDTENIWVAEVDVVGLAEVLGDGLRSALTKREGEVLCTLREEPLNNTGVVLRCSLLACIREDADARDKPVETVVFALREAARGRKYIGVLWPSVFAEEL